jgi:hypothetical protein
VEITDGMESNQRDEQERWMNPSAGTAEGRKSRKWKQMCARKELWVHGQSCSLDLEVFLEPLE